MGVNDLRKYYRADTDKELSSIILTGTSTISEWRKFGIPERTQAYFQVITKNSLKADIAGVIPAPKKFNQTKNPTVISP